MDSSRYAYMYKKAAFDYLISDFLAFAWITSPPSKMQNEIRAVKYRLEIDDSDFKVDFIQNLPKGLSK